MIFIRVPGTLAYIFFSYWISQPVRALGFSVIRNLCHIGRESEPVRIIDNFIIGIAAIEHKSQFLTRSFNIWDLVDIRCK